MARSYNVVEVNKFNAGLITDASPLTSPENSSLEEDNFVLNIDGSRNRRLGMDYEENFVNISTNITNLDSLAITTFRWNNAGGQPDQSIEVVQTGNELKFFDLNNQTVSQGLFYTEIMDSNLSSTLFSYAVVDGLLVVSTGEKVIHIFEKVGSSITKRTTRLLIRDLFGVEDVIGGVDITRSADVQNRPLQSTSAHIYNLRNQSWGVPRIDGSDNPSAGSTGSGGVLNPKGTSGTPSTPNSVDPISPFKAFADQKFPSNSDSVVQSLYADPENKSNRTIDRFFAEDLVRNPLGSGRAAQGYFIIDALDRGSSRLSEESKNRNNYPQLNLNIVSSLPQDSTPTGARTISEFSGRVFYAGFSGAVVDGDRYSPKMSSYVLFSKIVDSAADINLCYQESDPTSKDSPEIVDTDGGFIRINEAYDIQQLINVGDSLMIVAANGIWRIIGGDNGFTATQYIVDKISDRGCTSANSITMVDGGFMFWGTDAIYHVTKDQYGGWGCNNLTFGRIQKLYDSIPVQDKNVAKGNYDTYERKVRWVYYIRADDDTSTRELVLDLQLQAFYLNTIKKLNNTTFPRVVSSYIGKPYIISNENEPIVVGVEIVTVGSEPVIALTDDLVTVSQRELGYLIVTGVSPTLTYTFGSYRNTGFREWFSQDGVGVDADAYLVTSYMSGSDFQRDKQTPYITVHLRRTETGFSNDGEMTPENPSSCLMQARWDWSDSGKSGKWGREFQAYRYRRTYLPLNDSDTYDNGFSTIVSRNKVRGNGKVLSLRFRTEPDKDLHLYGWSMIFSVAEEVD